MDRSAGRSSGTFAAMVRPNSTAVPSHGTCSLRPSQLRRPSVIRSGVRLNDTSVVIWSPTTTSRPAFGPTSATVPTSMPPDPVTGFCILPRSATMASTSARTASPSPWCFSLSWRKLAASRLSRATSIRISSGHRSGSASNRRAACGRTPDRLQHAVQADRRRRGGAGHAGRSSQVGRPGLAQMGPFLAAMRGHCREILRSVVAQTATSSYPPPMSDHALPQPYEYRYRALVEPDWTRLPAWAGVTSAGVGGRPVAARPLREERQAAARA